MKDGRTHLAHKAEHAVDLETGAIVGLTVQDADDGDTTTSRETLIEAAEQVEAVWPDGKGIEEVVGDKGYHSNQSLIDLEAVGVRSYISEPDRGPRNWKKNPTARDAVYRNRNRLEIDERLIAEHSKAPTDSCRRLQPRPAHAATDRRRHAARAARAARRRRGRPLGADSLSLGVSDASRAPCTTRFTA
jgi:hypothetical protein